MFNNRNDISDQQYSDPPNFGVFVSQLVRYNRAFSIYPNFLIRITAHIEALVLGL